MARRSRDPFDVDLDAEQRQQLAIWLANEVQAALDARASNERDVDYWHILYEQGRTRTGRNLPWPDAADLTSYLGTEKVDALHARLMRTLWVEPIWTVEGWGEAADRAPFVEEFHQWKAEEERLQGVIDKAALIALIEPRGLLEVYEDTDRRTTQKQIRALVETQIDPLTGEARLVYDDTGKPQLQQREGQFVEATDDTQPFVDMTVDSTERVRSGPLVRSIPYRDSVILPGHAREKDELWGYGKRFWRRLPEIQRAAKAGTYDPASVDRLTTTGEREPDGALERSQQTVAPQDGPTAEKELWELLVLVDLDQVVDKAPRSLRGERWYLLTLHLGQQLLLRVQHDDLNQRRFIPIVLFPRPDRAAEGFSFIGHKLITAIEEHTAWRNMIADRAAMVAQAPIKRLTGALWDPNDQPWGPKAVIDVRDMNEVQAMVVPDVPASLIERERTMPEAAERLAGINDVAAGTLTDEKRTLGEVQLVAEQSFVRMELVIKRFQEAMEDLAQIRHEIWKRTLREQSAGMEAPASFRQGIEARGISIDQFLPDGKITAALLDGAFRFKPRGSVETADTNRLRYDFVAAMQSLPALIQVFPMLAPQLATPQAARAMFEQFVRVFRLPNRQAFLGSMAPSPMLGQPGMPGPAMGAPGLPPGMPPMGLAPLGLGAGVAPLQPPPGGEFEGGMMPPMPGMVQ